MNFWALAGWTGVVVLVLVYGYEAVESLVQNARRTPNCKNVRKRL